MDTLRTGCEHGTRADAKTYEGPQRRKSSETPKLEAIFSVAASVLFKALAISCTGHLVFASDFSLRKSACVQRATAPSGILKLEALFLVESRLRLSRRATAAAGNFCLASALS